MALATDPHLAPRLKSGAIPLLPLWSFVACSSVNFTSTSTSPTSLHNVQYIVTNAHSLYSYRTTKENLDCQQTPVDCTLTAQLTLWPWSWTFTVERIMYVKCEYFMNQEG